MSLATSYMIDSAEIQHIDTLLKQFITWFYDQFYGQKYDRLQVCKYTVHALLHLSREVRNWGPASYFWQYAEVSWLIGLANCLRNAYVEFLYVLSRAVCVEQRTWASWRSNINWYPLQQNSAFSRPRLPEMPPKNSVSTNRSTNLLCFFLLQNRSVYTLPKRK